MIKWKNKNKFWKTDSLWKNDLQKQLQIEVNAFDMMSCSKKAKACLTFAWWKIKILITNTGEKEELEFLFFFPKRQNNIPWS